MADKLMRTALVMSFFLAMAFFSGCGTNEAQATQADNGGRITLQPGEVMTVTLNSNPTTGYGWQVLKINNAILVQEGDSVYEQSENSEGLVGAGGTETFRFKAVGSGETSLELGYMRPWEDVPPIETYSVLVIVQ
jgi:inhibitor of cysteine peptidase